jgi:hypothetical protein
MAMKTPVADRHYNPAPTGPQVAKGRPRPNILSSARRQMRHDVRERIKSIRREVSQGGTAVLAETTPTYTDSMPVKDLREAAKAQGISGYSKMKKADLLAALRGGVWS